MRRARYVQLKNPRTGRYVKIDRVRGVIISHKVSPGPYAGIPITRRRHNARSR